MNKLLMPLALIACVLASCGRHASPAPNSTGGSNGHPPDHQQEAATNMVVDEPGLRMVTIQREGRSDCRLMTMDVPPYSVSDCT